MAEFFSTIANSFEIMFNTVHLNDLADIAIVAFIIYNAIKLVRETRAETLVKGILILIVMAALANYFDLKTFKYIMTNVFQIGLLALLIVFQPELRRVLEQMGRTRIGKLNILSSSGEDDAANIRHAIKAVCDSCTILQRQRMGALIVFEREIKLGDIINSGTIVDASPSPELICNVFYNKAPLHDGAMVIRDGKVYAAACILPLSQNREISTELGTRHRAALGMSENSDAMVVVVSEETGSISVAEKGVLRRSISVDTLKAVLDAALLDEKNADGSKDKPSFWKGRNK